MRRPRPAALIEKAERWANGLERRFDREALPPLPRGADPRSHVRALAAQRHGYVVHDDVDAWLHAALGAPWPCLEDERLAAVWRALARELDGADEPGTGWDADAALARAAFCATRHMRADRVVETGVARGITTRFLLEAVGDAGRVWSIDILPADAAWAEMARAAVPREVRDRWTYVSGSSRRRLPGLLRAVGPIDVFLHDSHHTGRTMRFELAAAWPVLRPGGVLLCDDVQDNGAFAELARALPAGHAAVGQEERKATLFGVAVKPGPPA